MPNSKGSAYACQPSKATKAVIRAVPAPTQDSRLFNILSDHEIRSQFDQTNWRKVFFSTTTQNARNPRAKAAPKADVCDAHKWQPDWSPERVKNAVCTTTNKESYKEIDNDHVLRSVMWKPEDTIRVFFQPPEKTVSEYANQYDDVDKRFYAKHVKVDNNECSMRPLDLGVETDSHEHSCFRAHPPRLHRPKLCAPFETEREMSKRTRHMRAAPQKTTYQVFAGSPPKPQPNIRKVLAGVSIESTPRIVTHKGT
eukprot:gnl/MRDRNA2_/MRDRNA2_89915_c0_seq1.p1 gnl/MRDRNA2_/MRDRNA2_89915_c0~~gnl/MRDRNA2_/MRDRNA2_89915_c0_seq1.p1  ORF type:complete len:254 (+),score=32.23 gnl/MRDRNA2_/MRDRNA2_89915_c0_seq1:103-864(+)